MRYRIIDASLRNKFKRYPNKFDLMRACENLGSVSLRTIEKDLYDMMYDEELAYRAPIAYSRSEKGYYYEDPNYSINQFPIQESDLSALEFACSILRQFGNIDPARQLLESIDKMETYMRASHSLESNSWQQYIQAEKSLGEGGMDFMGPLLDSIRSKNKCFIKYRRFNSEEEKSYIFHPYVLKQYRNRWYVIGYFENRKASGCQLIIKHPNKKTTEDTRLMMDPKLSIQQTQATVLDTPVLRQNKLPGTTLPVVAERPKKEKTISNEDNDLTFEGTKIIKEEEFEQSGKTKLEAYLSTYYAYYNDSVGIGQYQKFPSSAPTSNRFSLNMLMVKASYHSNFLRGTFALHTGDIPSCAWSSEYNFIQEANMGVKLLNNVWIDAGFFRTHLGVESIQPRENITSSISTTTYYEPYYLSGAKLTTRFSDKFTFQTGIFNGFNTFVENNSNKTISFSFVYDPNNHLSFVNNTIICDESPDYQSRKQQRFYNNFYFTYKSKKWDLAGEFNMGLEKNAGLKDNNATAYMMSALLVSRLHWNKKISSYGRLEYFLDKNEILTGPVLNSYHQLVGLHLIGGSFGLELKPIKNSYFRLEWRRLFTLDKDENVFYYKQAYHHYRDEIISSLGFWF